MSLRTCTLCGCGDLGPWEASPCPSVLAARGKSLGNADAAVYVLERADGPLSIYDIQRGITRNFGWEPYRPSLTVSVANDLRCCWAGKGLYALYRHGLIPGPRKLVDVAKIVLQAQDTELTADEISFAMRHLGYRFQKQSLINALLKERSIERVAWRTWVFGTDRPISNIRVAPTVTKFERVVERVRQSVSLALVEHRRRLSRTGLGLADTDSIYTDGSQPPAEPWRDASLSEVVERGMAPERARSLCDATCDSDRD